MLATAHVSQLLDVGVPPSRREEVWQLLSDLYQARNKEDWLYPEELCGEEAFYELGQQTTEYEHSIDVDLSECICATMAIRTRGHCPLPFLRQNLPLSPVLLQQLARSWPGGAAARLARLRCSRSGNRLLSGTQLRDWNHPHARNDVMHREA